MSMREQPPIEGPPLHPDVNRRRTGFEENDLAAIRSRQRAASGGSPHPDAVAENNASFDALAADTAAGADSEVPGSSPDDFDLGKARALVRAAAAYGTRLAGEKRSPTSGEM